MDLGLDCVEKGFTMRLGAAKFCALCLGSHFYFTNSTMQHVEGEAAFGPYPTIFGVDMSALDPPFLFSLSLSFSLPLVSFVLLFRQRMQRHVSGPT